MSGHSERSGRECDAGGGFQADGMPWPDAVARVNQVRDDRAGAPAQAGQSVGRNHPKRLRSMDGGHLEEGVWGSHLKRRHGDGSGAVHKRKVANPLLEHK